MTTWQLREDWEGDPVRPRLLRLGVRRLARRLDRHGHRRRPRRPGHRGGRDRLGDEPHRRRRRCASSCASARRPRRFRRAARSPSSARRRRASSCDDHGDRRRRRGQPAAADPARGHRGAAGRRVRRRDASAWRRRRPSSRPGRRMLPARRAPRRSRCATPRAGAPTPSATGSSCSTCSGYPKAPASVVADGVRRRHAHPPRRSRARRVRPTRRSPGSSSARTTRSSPSAPPTARARRSRRPTASSATYEAFAVNAVGESRASVRTVAWAYDPPPAPASVIDASGRDTGGEGGVVALSIEGIDAVETGSVEITSATGETVRVPVGPGRRASRCPSYRVGTNTVDPDHGHAVLALRACPRASAAARRGARRRSWANGIGAPRDVALDAHLRVRRRRHVDRHRARVSALSAATARRCATASSAREAPARPPSAGPRRPSPGSRTARSTASPRASSPGTTARRSGATTDTETVRASAVRQSPARMDLRRRSARRTSPARARSGSSGRSPRSDERVPNQNRVEFGGWGPGTSVFDRDPAIQRALRARVLGDRDAVGERRSRRRAARPIRCRRAGGCSPASAAARWSRWATRRTTPPAARRRSRSATGGLRYYDADRRAAAAARPTPGPSRSAPSRRGHRRDGRLDAQGWGLAPATATLSAHAATPTSPSRRARLSPRAVTGRRSIRHPSRPRTASMTITQEQATWFAQTFAQLADNVERAVLGKRHVVELVLTAMLSDGHVLLEDVPGHRQDLARARDGAVGAGHATPASSSRPTCCPATSPASRVYDQKEGEFEFHAGPIFANIVLADEINRASPKTQSALLEVMEEGSVTIDGVTRPVGVPVPRARDAEPRRAGRHLPAARGAARPLHDARRRSATPTTRRPCASSTARRSPTADLGPDHHAAGARRHGRPRRARSTSTPLVLDYIARLVDSTRSADEVRLGVSIRGALALTARRAHPRGVAGAHLRDPRRRQGARRRRCSRTA